MKAWAHLKTLLLFPSVCLGIVFVDCWVPVSVFAQLPPSGERYTLVLPSDPFKWEHALNELGEKGWDGMAALQPSVGGLTLHFVVCVRTQNAKAVAYKVIVAEFSSRGDGSSIEATRLQLEIQGNAYSQSGWQLVQPLTGRRGEDHAFMAIIFKKPQ